MLENDLDAVSRRLANRLAEATGVEGRVGAKLESALSLRFRAAGHQDARADVPGDLDRGYGDTCTRADDEDGLVRAQLRACGEHPPGGEKGERKSGRLLPAEAARLAEHTSGVDVDELARRAVRVLAEHSEMRAAHVLTGAAPLAFPVAKR